MKVLFVTGYKAHELGIFKNNHKGVTYIKRAIKKSMLPLVEAGLEWVIISGQLGVELWAGEAVQEMQESFPELKLAVLTPFLEQEKNWSQENKEYYEGILIGADFVDSISKKPYENPSQLKQKNQFLLQKSDGLLILYDEEKEGTPKYVWQEAKKLQEQKDFPIWQITFYDLQQVVEEEQLGND
ncbi:DUF1273 domain-containing protein [Peribacillus tepidiphilus]|uniref:DUF1273 domain-containing protein n=1 Tax=Peribacillus tepidiphilus TaxID=2652445 RepID=UPI00129151DA|nr:DUF1273 domain-containing protein [Peribacillus tepidiphilus]